MKTIFSLINILFYIGVLFFFYSCGGGSEVDTSPKVTDEVIYSNDKGLKSLGVADKPPFFISIEDPAPNEMVNISIDASAGTIVSVEAQGSGCGDILSQSGIAPFSISGNAGTDGYCNITATYDDGNKLQKKSGRFIVASAYPNLPPVSCDNGMWVTGELPKVSTILDSDAKLAVGFPRISTIDGPREFINGGSSEFTVHSAGGANISGVLVKVDSYNGYYHIPIYTSGHSGKFKFSFATNFFDDVRKVRANDGMHLTLIVIDDLNQVSDSSTIELKANETGFGDVKVSISWDTPTDVDLFITDPNGVMTGYSSQHPGNGSHHDLDSNAGCTIDGKNNENIFWDTATAVPGEYTVTIDMYDNCSEREESDLGASGTLTMIYGGENSPERISWSLGSSGSKRFKFVHAGAKYKVSGKVTYEDFPVTREGLGKSRMLPVRYANVKVIGYENEVLAEGSTDIAGNYAFSFNIDDIEHPKYKVYIYAQNNKIFKQEVLDGSGNVYVFGTKTYVDVTETPEKKDLDIAIKKDDNAAAMNIFDVGIWCNMYARTYGGKVPEELVFYWPTSDVPYSYYSNEGFRHISILMNGADHDEYDDLVIGHEYGHFVMDVYSNDNNPGDETHTIYRRMNPALAWSEGWATFFSAMSLNKSFYVDTSGTDSVSYYSLETLPADVPLGNDGNKLDGDLSEAVVSAVLWDLYDSTDETYDTLNSKSTAIWSVLTTYLNGTDFKDRGKTGVDLVDFLDGWFYLGYGNTGDEEIGMIANVWFLHNLLGYDFKINPK